MKGQITKHEWVTPPYSPYWRKKCKHCGVIKHMPMGSEKATYREFDGSSIVVTDKPPCITRKIQTDVTKDK